MSDSTKILILVSTVIIVCVLCAVGFKLVNEGKSSVNASTNSFNSMTSQYSEIDLLIYDGAMVQGSEVVSLINKVVKNDEYISIVVETKAGEKTQYNYKFNYPVSNTDASLGEKVNKGLQTNKTEKDYINPSAQFSGKVYKNANGVIICIEFKQTKSSN